MFSRGTCDQVSQQGVLKACASTACAQISVRESLTVCGCECATRDWECVKSAGLGIPRGAGPS